MKNEWVSPETLRREQNWNLIRNLKYCYNQIPYYHRLFKERNLTPENFKTKEDLIKLPILTKNFVKANLSAFLPYNIKKTKYTIQSTGGTTGTPFIYYLSKYDRFLSAAMTYRAWSRVGYRFGDKIVFIGGASISPFWNMKFRFQQRMHQLMRNLRYINSFDLSPKKMRQSLQMLLEFKPKIIRGYPSAIEAFGNWGMENFDEVFSPEAIITTSEKLFPQTRKKIEDYFDSVVIDTYGLNDGGISANECQKREGLHIDTEKSILEVTDEEGTPLEGKEGKILATNLFNPIMPLLRYDSGDLGILKGEDPCSCGRGLPLLKEIIGRSTDMLYTPDGRMIHGWYFLYIFWEYFTGIREYQVIQSSLDQIKILIVPEENQDPKDEIIEIEKIVKAHVPSWHLEFETVESIPRPFGKMKFIFNKMK